MTITVQELHQSRRQRNVLVLLWCSALLLLALTWGQAYKLSEENRERELASSLRDLGNLTRLSQEHTNRTLRSADQALRFVQARYLEIGNRLDLGALTRQGVIDTEIFNQVGVIDEKGMYILSNRPINGKMDLSDREHFRVHVEKDTGELFISKPVIGRATGKWSIQLTRRINRADGTFGGVVVISIDPGYFSRFYGEVNLGPSGLMTLINLDGVVLARRTGNLEEFGNNAKGAGLFEHMAANKTFGSYTQRSVVDGVERLMYFRKIPQYPLVAVAGIETQFLLSNHYKTNTTLVVQAGLVSLLVVVLAAGLARHLAMLGRESQARREAQLQIHDRTEQLNAVFELSPDGFVSFDHNHCVKYVNPAFTQMTVPGTIALEGMEERDFSAWLAQLCEPASAFQGLAAMRAHLQSQDGSAGQIIELKNFGKRILQVQLRTSESSSVSQILYFRDITHETEVESLKSEFLATAAHELRTPMASIFGFAEVLLSHPGDVESNKEFLGIIHRQSKLMVEILNELLDLARIEARRGKDFQYVRLCLQDLLREMIAAYQCPDGRSAPQFIAPQEPVYLMADSGKLRQALLNVLANAYKYSPQGGPVTIEVLLQQNAQQTPHVLVRIADHGIGMTAEQTSKVFTRFYRADTSGKVPGTGLGMSITKEIIEHHRGQISIVSAPGAGTQVSLLLPAEQPSQDA